MATIGTRILAGVVIALLAASPSWARVGVASVVDGEPKGLPPSGTERVLHIGNDMEPNERVTTGAKDKAHIVFLDGSSLTVGPNSVLTIDKFVYNPERKSGELALNASRGVFRFVGGAISKNAEVTIKTPAATMGIRGGIASFAVANNGATTANLIFGVSLSVTTPGGTTVLTEPGTTCEAPGGNAPPTPPAPTPPGGPAGNASFQQAGGGPASSAIGAAFANSGLSGSNSAIPPSVAYAAVPGTQQAQLRVAAGPQQGNRPVQGGVPQQGSGPIQAASSLQGASPLQGTGPLQGAPPLQGAGPVQAVGPAMGTEGFAGLTAPQAPGAPPPGVGPIGPLPGPYLTNLGNLSPELITLLVNALTPDTPAPDAPTPPTPIPVSTTPVTPQLPPGPGPQLPITPLPPSVFNPTCQTQISQTNC